MYTTDIHSIGKKAMSNSSDDGQTQREENIYIASQFLLFFLVLGFAATVHYQTFKDSVASKGVIVCLLLQAIVMPFIGFLHVITITSLEPVVVVSLMIVLSSPGGAYSNFYNSLFNGDLSLSVAMTTVSTFFSVLTLPLNLFFYVGVLLSARNDEEVGKLIDWGVLAQTVAIIVSGISVGLLLNYKFPQHSKKFNIFANLCGVTLIIMSLAITNSDDPVWEQPLGVIVASFLPPLIALFLTVAICLKLGIDKPKIFAITIEVCLQNSGVALTFALAAFSGDEQQQALAVPILYGLANSLYCIGFAVFGFKMGWTYTPKGISLYKALLFNHQPTLEERKQTTVISTVEVLNGGSKQPTL